MAKAYSIPVSIPFCRREVPSRPSQLRQTNARGLLQLLQEHHPCSKADLVRYSGLSAPTVSSGIAHLEALGLVEQIGDGESSGGRPPTMLRFNSRHGFVAAADIGGTRIRMMLADLGGNVVTQSSFLLGARDKTPLGVCRQVAEGLRAMCRQSGTPLQKVLHITAGAPGITNVDSGVVLSAPNLDQWDEVPFVAMLERELAIPALVENDTNLAALGEHWRGSARGVESFIFIAIGTGVGAGIFINGQLHRGAQWSAGEIGYFGVPGKKRGPVRMRELGQMEQMIGGGGVEAEWQRVLAKRSGSLNIAPRELRAMKELKASQIFDLAAEGDRTAGEVVRFVATILGDAIADMSLLLNPAVIVLGGGVGSHPELCRVTEKMTQENEFAHPSLRSSGLGTHAQLYGAVSLSLLAVEKQILE